MTRRLWGRASSGNVQKAIWALEELALPYEHIEAGGAHGIVGEARYRAMNPNGLVPTLEEDGFVLWESNAILRYLAHAHGGVLALPEEPRDRALIDQWLDWQATAFTPAMRDAFLQLVRVAPEKRNAAVIEASQAAGERCADMLDRHLASTPYVAGESVLHRRHRGGLRGAPLAGPAVREGGAPAHRRVARPAGATFGQFVRSVAAAHLSPSASSRISDSGRCAQFLCRIVFFRKPVPTFRDDAQRRRSIDDGRRAPTDRT